MKIYRVDADTDKFQYFMFEDSSVYETGHQDLYCFDATPKAENWVPPAVYIYEAKLERGNFFKLWPTNAFVVDQVALEALGDLLEISGELLPLPYKGELYHVVNVTQCFDMLDNEKTEWQYGKGRLPITKYVFHRTRVAEVPLFKIPETCDIETLAIEFCGDPECECEEFKARVEQLGLTGLRFTELWNDGA